VEGPVAFGMARPLQRDSEGVASTVATIFSLVIILLFMQITIVSVVPAREYEAEWTTSLQAIDAFERIRLAAHIASVPGSEFTVTVPLGTVASIPFGTASDGRLSFIPAGDSALSVSMSFVPNLRAASVLKVDQDVILLMDSSGSMVWNDPARLRISSAKEYVGQLTLPDRVAIVDFDDNALFTRANVGGPVHHLFTPGHNGPPYTEAQSDLDTIDASGSTNFGDAIRIANDEFIAYGDRNHAWVMILLTDGRNTVRGADAMARSEAQEALALGITIYTIGLGNDLNEPLLREIAETTGGTYYHASTAAEIRWIYLEISRRYSGSFQCGIATTHEPAFGTLELFRANRRYPAQTVRLEGGAIDVRQPTGSLLREGLPLVYEQKPEGASVSLTLLTFVGEPKIISGIGNEIVTGRVLGADRVDQPIAKVPLNETSDRIQLTWEEFDFWADQGAATPAAAAAVEAPMTEAERLARWAYENQTARDVSSAKNLVDRAQGQLSAAVEALEDGEASGEIQSWLVASTRDSVLLDACRLDQWRNWYDGISLRVTSASAAAWAAWFVEEFGGRWPGVSTGMAGNETVVSLHGVDRFILDTRVIEISIGGLG